eukprot:IDg16969t1
MLMVMQVCRRYTLPKGETDGLMDFLMMLSMMCASTRSEGDMLCNSGASADSGACYSSERLSSAIKDRCQHAVAEIASDCTRSTEMSKIPTCTDATEALITIFNTDCSSVSFGIWRRIKSFKRNLLHGAYACFEDVDRSSVKRKRKLPLPMS